MSTTPYPEYAADSRRCKRIHKKYGKSFYFGTLLLSKEEFEATCVLYAFFRYPDEYVDTYYNDQADIAHEKVSRWNRLWNDFYQGTLDSSEKLDEEERSILRATAYVFHRYSIPYELSESFLAAMFQDTEKDRYETYEELEAYMYGSASVVGLMMAYVLCSSDARFATDAAYRQRILDGAQALGEAFQMTNFLRDVGEDVRDRRRIYLPREDIQKYRVHEVDIEKGIVSPEFVSLIRFEIERTQELYRKANEGIALLPKRAGRALYIARVLYSAILKKIEDAHYDVLSRRAHLSFSEKTVAALYAARRFGGNSWKPTTSTAIRKKVVIIGGGIGGLALACMLGKKGYAVIVLEKNKKVGGKANIYAEDGFVFDMGPSWYMMPDIFEHFFEMMGEKIEDYLTLTRLSPSYRIFLKSGSATGENYYDFYSDLEKTITAFEAIEPGSGEKLRAYIKRTEYQYTVARDEFMFKNYNSIFDFFTLRVVTEARKLPLFSSVESIINKLFKSEILRKVMQYQTVLLGTAPGDAPGIYSMMNYVDFVGGVWYPEGGIYKVIEALEAVARKNGVEIRTEASVAKILVEKAAQGKPSARGVLLENGEQLEADLVISNADMVHTDDALLEPMYRQKSKAYWNTRLMAPSAFILYLGVEGEIPSLQHHNLLFAENWNENFKQIFNTPEWPKDPSLYVCVPSKSDEHVAPEGMENLFVLVPVAADLAYDAAHLEEYAKMIITQMETHMHIPHFAERIRYQRIYAVDDFRKDYNAFKGSALGFAHSLGQTAIFRPNNVNPKVDNVYYVGAGTNPGIGMPICLISAELAYKRIENIRDAAPLKRV